MRTTVTLDSDVAHLLREEAHRSRTSFKAVLNEAVRRGLAPAKLESSAPYRVEATDLELRSDLSQENLDDAAEDFELEAFRRTARKLASQLES